MLSVRDRLLLCLWLLPVALGLVVGLRTGDDDGPVVLFVTGLVAALYAVALLSTVHHARGRPRWAGPEPEEPGPGGPGAADPVTAGSDAPGPEHPGAPGGRGRARTVTQGLQLVLVVSAAVYVVAEGGWTFVVVAAQLVTVITMAAHVHGRGAEPDPVL